MKWEKVDEYFYKNNGWTMTNIANTKLPFGLYKQDKLIECFKTAKEAYDKHAELMKDEAMK